MISKICIFEQKYIFKFNCLFAQLLILFFLNFLSKKFLIEIFKDSI
jgi:hypothetical protein